MSGDLVEGTTDPRTCPSSLPAGQGGTKSPQRRARGDLSAMRKESYPTPPQPCTHTDSVPGQGRQRSQATFSSRSVPLHPPRERLTHSREVTTLSGSEAAPGLRDIVSGGITIIMLQRLPGTGREPVGVRTFAYTFVPPALIMLAVALTFAVGGVPVEKLTTEPTTIADLPPYTGAVSTLGILGWGAAVGIFLMGACHLYERLDRRDAAFLGLSAAITAYLCLDDAFTFHEAVLPALGIPEAASYLFIGALVLLYGALFREQIRAGAWLFLALAIGLLGLSVAIDAAWEILDPYRGAAIEMLLEDGAKLFGISAWIAYAAMSTRGLLRRHSRPALI